MENLRKARDHENLHIILWLIKDSCWMLELKWLGSLMILPALGVAVYFSYLTRGFSEFYLNIAVFFWILANSYWMVTEFFFEDRFRDLAAIPFGLGFLFAGLYYYRNHKAVKAFKPS